MIHAKDVTTEVHYTYTANRQVKTRKQGNRKVELKYDDEEHLVQIINEKGETYEFKDNTMIRKQNFIIIGLDIMIPN